MSDLEKEVVVDVQEATEDKKPESTEATTKEADVDKVKIAEKQLESS